MIKIPPRLLIFHELIGLKCRVISSENKYNIGIEGTIIKETKNFIIIDGKMIKKKNSIFLITLPSNKKVLVQGNILLLKPVDRTKLLKDGERYAKRNIRISSSRKHL